MSGTHPSLTTPLTAVPVPRRPLELGAFGDDPVRRWYENELGWPTVPASTAESPLRLRLGLRFDVLDVPAEAGRAALRHLAGTSPVAMRGDRAEILVAAGSTEELPGLLDWLEWGALALGLRAIGTGGVMRAPRPPDPAVSGLGAVPSGRPTGPGEDVPLALPAHPEPGALQGAAVWLRPPEPGCEVEASLPTLSALGGDGGAPDLVRVVNTVATHCHRLRLRRTRP
ncbi:SCO3374 family protein [Streptomyces canus]|uniref:SCO3374 family protein n=1 Tax=Streptomyces canus TaxID=58343 RepID=UPI002E334945|nr:SCO3374 family protein [Streptomyces canus]